MNLGTFIDFLKRLKESFEPHNNAADALTQLRALQYKLRDNIDEHITKVRMCLARTKLDKSNCSQAIIEFKKKNPSSIITEDLRRRNHSGDTH